MRLTTRDIAALRRRGAIVQGEPCRVDPSVRSLTVAFPLRLGLGLNSREHWRKRAERVKRERAATREAFLLRPLPAWPVVITITRVGRRRCDSDTIPGAAKAVRDEIAAMYGVDDGDERYEWKYEQRQAGEYMVVVEIEAR